MMKNGLFCAVCLLVCLCLATSIAEEEVAHRVKRITCGGIVEEIFGSRACNAHCRVRGRSRGGCSGGTCYCSRGGSSD